MTGLHLLRHAHAGDPERWDAPDAARPLSERGRRQAVRLGALLAAMDERPDVFVTSPKIRAAQTAELVAEAIGAPVVVDARLALGLDVRAVEEILLESAPDAARPCLVGHDPDFSRILGDLLGIAPVPMRKGAIARIDVARPIAYGRGVLRWLVPPEVVPR